MIWCSLDLWRSPLGMVHIPQKVRITYMEPYSCIRELHIHWQDKGNPKRRNALAGIKTCGMRFHISRSEISSRVVNIGVQIIFYNDLNWRITILHEGLVALRGGWNNHCPWTACLHRDPPFQGYFSFWRDQTVLFEEHPYGHMVARTFPSQGGFTWLLINILGSGSKSF